jgi:aspartate racemase
MKTIGLLGGMSWESTALYYRWINELTRELLGGTHSARLLMLSVDFHEIEILQHVGQWQQLGDMLTADALRLQTAGAELLLICTNTMHIAAPQIEAALSIPLLHIADPTGAALRQAGLWRVGLLGTRFTMEQPFYAERLRQKFGLDVLVPPPAERDIVHRVIYEELVRGIVRTESAEQYRQVIMGLAEAGAQAIIAGCTEIGLLVKPGDCPLPLYDTALLHARAAVDAALA